MKGIYQIRNLNNGKRYIGSTLRNFKGRWKVHKSLLNNNKHSNKHLQLSWNKYGEKSFVFEILFELEDNDEILKKEIEIILETKVFQKENGYNSMTSNWVNPMFKKRTRGMLGKKHSDESRQKIKERHADFSGDKNGRTHLTWDDVREIRKLYKEKNSFKVIIEKFKIGRTTFYHIINKDTWREND